MEKVSLRHIYLEVGRWCNLRCAHCCKGEPQHVQMSDSVMDALLDNVHFIDEITVTGGEPMLYVERMRTLLNKCKEKNVRVNYFSVITNCTIRSEEFVNLFNDWIDYCTFGQENGIIISTDKFHREYIAECMKDCDVSRNKEWYTQHIKPCKYLGNTEKQIDADLFIFKEGRVRKWSQEQLNKYVEVAECQRKKCRNMMIPIKKHVQVKKIYVNMVVYIIV